MTFHCRMNCGKSVSTQGHNICKDVSNCGQKSLADCGQTLDQYPESRDIDGSSGDSSVCLSVFRAHSFTHYFI